VPAINKAGILPAAPRFGVMTWWVTLMTAEPPQSDAESTKPDANSRRSNNQIATVVVPIVVAVIGLIGVIIASIIASQDNGNGADGGQTTEDPNLTASRWWVGSAAMSSHPRVLSCSFGAVRGA
jgi:hypothetical protein